MTRAEVRVTLHHSQGFPASQHLHRPQIHAGHDEPGGEAVAVTVPGVADESGGILPLFFKSRSRPPDRLREGTGDRAICCSEDRLLRIVWPLPAGAEID